ncbi:uncharacterized protein [Euphorbia lathyris]|uniref:uncharacterized protein n=1 Tax=Euphorbia lathyris TaxID=212925 RepID=UPI0033133033
MYILQENCFLATSFGKFCTNLVVLFSIFQLGGGYLFGLPVGFIADSIGATIGATAAFLLIRTIGRPFIVSKLKDYPQFRSVAIVIQKSGFKIVLLLQLVPLLPFNMMNYLLSVTPVSVGQYMLASWKASLLPCCTFSSMCLRLTILFPSMPIRSLRLTMMVFR